VDGINFVVSIGADQHQVLHIRHGRQILEQSERCRVEPLQIVKEQGKRVFAPCEYAGLAPSGAEDQGLVAVLL
jgi:hypothetical protein